MFEFHNGRLNGIGGETSLKDRQRAKLTMNLQETENGHISSVEIVLLVPNRPDATLLELEQAARRQAQAILTESLAELERSSIADWTAAEWARREVR